MNSCRHEPPWTQDDSSSPFGSHVRWHSLVRFAVLELQIRSPHEFRLKSGAILRILAEQPNGLSTEALVRALNPDFDRFSTRRQASMTTSLYKLIQRTRRKLQPVALDIEASRALGTFRLIPTNHP
jgi:hypothetical protein